jgi:regulator of cell morphogenesis and NO signaling
MEISPQTSLADLVVQQPGRARVFERFGVDYCCHGRLSLAEACQEAGVEYKQVRRELEASDSGPGPFEEDWSAEPLSRLIEHIVEIHHNYLRCELPRLEGLMTKVAIHHGLRYHQLADLAEVFLAMKSELLEHMNKEERILFPVIRRLEAGKAAPMTVNNPISVMEGDHRHVSEALAAIRRLTNDYTPPQDGCTAFGALMAGLEELEEDLHQHIHKENNILFPRAEKLERELAQFV